MNKVPTKLREEVKIFSEQACDFRNVHSNVNGTTMEKFLRDWRQDAMNKHQYESAIFIGDKLLALTRELSTIKFFG